MKTGYTPNVSDENTDIFQHSNQFMLKQIYSKCKNIIKIYTIFYRSGLYSGPTCMYNFSMLYELYRPEANTPQIQLSCTMHKKFDFKVKVTIFSFWYYTPRPILKHILLE